MKCISLWQPWASLIAIGGKSIETRSWPTSYRGPIAIHAAKKWERALWELCFTEPFWTWLQRCCEARVYYRHGNALPLGKIVATAELVGCEVITPENTPSGDERAFGDYAPGRYAWRLANVKALAVPPAVRGYQQIFDVDDAVIAAAGVAA